jgi:hypothetical protein
MKYFFFESPQKLELLVLVVGGLVKNHLIIYDWFGSILPSRCCPSLTWSATKKSIRFVGGVDYYRVLLDE